jgi:hypothetical protein
MSCIKKEINRPEGPVKLTFTSFDPGINNSPTENSYTKIYSGTGDNKKLVYTFDLSNKPNGTYTIDNKVVTIEFFSGHSNSHGFALNYTSPGADDVAPEPELNNAPTINNQQFIIKELDFSNNYVGKLVAFDSDANQVLTYSITSGNQSGIFNVDSKTGQLTTTRSDVFGFDLTEYNLTVQVTDNGTAPRSASASVNVKFIAANNVVYIDPSLADPNEDGTIKHPYNSWSDVAWNDGNTYLQKTGTTATVSDIVIGANKVTLGSYGEGKPPVIVSATNEYMISGFEKSDVTLHNLHLKALNAVSCIYFLGRSCVNITVEHCTLEGNENAFRAMDCQSVKCKYNTISSENEGIYSTASQNDIYYNVFKSTKNSVNIVGTSSKANVFNNVFINNTNAVSASYAELNLYNNIFYLSDESHKAISSNANKLNSDNNIFYPEQDGFIEIAGKAYNSLGQIQQQTDLDKHSLNSDPLFVDVKNDNYTLETFSPAVNAGINLNLGHDFYGQAVPVAGLPDIGIAEFTGKVAGQNNIEPTMVLYPNPSAGYVNIQADLTNTSADPTIDPLKSTKSIPSEISVMDMDGKLVFRKIVENTEALIQEHIDLTGKLNGLYLIILKIADKTITEKLTINH